MPSVRPIGRRFALLALVGCSFALATPASAQVVYPDQPGGFATQPGAYPYNPYGGYAPAAGNYVYPNNAGMAAAPAYGTAAFSDAAPPPPLIRSLPFYRAQFPDEAEPEAPKAEEVAGPVFIINPARNGVTLNYQRDGKSYRIDSGIQQKINTKAGFEVRFDRGANLGQSTQKLTAGRYEFRHGEQGWDLIRLDAPAPTTPVAIPPVLPDSNPAPATPPRGI